MRRRGSELCCVVSGRGTDDAWCEAARWESAAKRHGPGGSVRVHLINPSHLSFGVAVITPRWLSVLASATPAVYGDPVIADETLAPLDLD